MSEEHLLDSDGGGGGGASVHIPLRSASVADDSTAPHSFAEGTGRHARLASLLQAYELAGEMSIADAQAIEMCLGGGGGGEIASAFGDEQHGGASFESDAASEFAAADIAPLPRPRSKTVAFMEASALKSMLQDMQPSAVASADSIAANTTAAMSAEQSWWCAECSDDVPSRTGAYVTDALRRWKARLPYYIPIFEWLPKYTRAKLIGDAAGGISAGFLALASGIALGGIAHSDALHGMYTAFYPSLVYTIFGSGSRINFGPETIVGTLYGQAIETLKENPDFRDPANRVGLEQLFSFLVGASVLVLGILRLGFLDSILAHTVVTGASLPALE
jgi:hypothetical protein